MLQYRAVPTLFVLYYTIYYKLYLTIFNDRSCMLHYFVYVQHYFTLSVFQLRCLRISCKTWSMKTVVTRQPTKPALCCQRQGRYYVHTTAPAMKKWPSCWMTKDFYGWTITRNSGRERTITRNGRRERISFMIVGVIEPHSS